MRFGSLALLGLATLAACGTTNNNTTIANPPTANGVFPASGFQGNKLRVEISGDATNWSTSTTVSFGAGITVASVEVAGPDDIFANITIDGSAAAGKQDVTVTDGSDTFTLAKAFEIDAPFTLVTTGTVAQGSVAGFTITSHDFATQFDATADAAGNFVNVGVTGPAGTLLTVSAVDQFHVSGSIFIDVDAASGGLTLTNGPAASATTIAAPALTIATRTATALTSGTPVTATIAAGGQADLYSITTGSGAEAVEVVATSTDTNPFNPPRVVLLPASGHFADLIDVSTQPAAISTTANDKFYAIYFDNTDSGYDYTLAPVVSPVGTVVSEGSNDTATAPQTLAAVPALITAATLSDGSDVDFYKITVAAGQVNKHIHVITTDGGQFTDSVVTIFGPNSTTAQFDASDDHDFGEDLDSAAITATGVYLIEVSLSSAANPATVMNAPYGLAVFFD